MESLNLPPVEFNIRDEGGKKHIYDAVRGVYVPLTIEEWVRQHFLQYLIVDRGVPPGLIGVEKEFSFQGMRRRADIVVHDRSAQPWLVVECKSPTISLDQSVFNQIGRYNRVLNAPFVGVTNGRQHFCFEVKNSEIHFVDEFPKYPSSDS